MTRLAKHTLTLLLALAVIGFLTDAFITALLEWDRGYSYQEVRNERT